MKRAQRFVVIINLAEKKQKAAEVVFVQAQNKLLKAKYFLAQLTKYKGDYQKLLGSYTGKTFPALNLENYYNFLQTISNTIDQQITAIKTLEEEVIAEKANWTQASQYLEKMKKTQEKILLAEQHKLNKKEQKELDEFALRRVDDR